MNKLIRVKLLACLSFFILSKGLMSQTFNDKLGAWYMYFWNTTIKEGPIGFQGDIQYRNWNIAGDLEQLLLRGGITYNPNKNVKLTLGYGNITTGTFGTALKGTTQESRIYQEALLPHKVGERVYLTHRFRYEQRFVENQDFRTRYRYNLFANIALNKKKMKKGTLYLALYNELFMNGQKRVSATATTQYFDRNRFYSAFGYYIKDNLKVQLGVMNQTNNVYGKNQTQLSLHHKI